MILAVISISCFMQGLALWHSFSFLSLSVSLHLSNYTIFRFHKHLYYISFFRAIRHFLSNCSLLLGPRHSFICDILIKDNCSDYELKASQTIVYDVNYLFSSLLLLIYSLMLCPIYKYISNLWPSLATVVQLYPINTILYTRLLKTAF